MKFKKVAQNNFYNPNQLAEEYINNGKRIVNTPDTIVISLSPKQTQFLHKLCNGDEQYYINGDRIYHWKLQKGVNGGDQLVVYYRQSREDYQQGIEPVRTKRKFRKTDDSQGELPL